MILSVIIPIYNSEKYLDKCISSLIESIKSANSEDRVEIICIDDASTDNGLRILNKYEKSYPNFSSIFMKENKGPAAARNLGLDRSSGDFICFVDSDDFVEEDYISLILEKIIANPLVEIIEIGAYSIDIFSNKTCIELISPPSLKLDYFQNFVYVCKYYLFTRIIKKDITKGLRFDESIRLCEDALYLTQCYINASIVKRIYSNIYNYVANENSLTANKSYQQIVDLKYIIDFSENKVRKRMFSEKESMMYLALLGNMLHFIKSRMVIISRKILIENSYRKLLRSFFSLKQDFYDLYGKNIVLRRRAIISLNFPIITNIYVLLKYT